MITSGAVFVGIYTITGVSPRDTPNNATLPVPWVGNALERHDDLIAQVVWTSCCVFAAPTRPASSPTKRS